MEGNNKDFVISGMAGRFPQSENVDIFWENLIRGNDMILEDNRSWDYKAFEVPCRMGNISHLDKFDASFFGVSGTQANTMDPKIRIAHEVAYEAIADAGLTYKSLDGARVGVFMATSNSEAAEVWLRSTQIRSGHYMLGCTPCMLADRISYSFNFHGPSCTMDSGCSSGFSALQYAMLALKNGLCDSAIVGGANILYTPWMTESFFKAKALSADGKCKTFDASCDGFARSEAVVALYICHKDQAKRSYASIAGVKCRNDGYKPEGIAVPSTEMQTQLIKELYSEVGVNPLEVLYVEAHGTGTKVGDRKEIASLAQSFCIGRSGPLLVGSVKSNMGHSETVAGLCGIVKVLLSKREGVIPRNLHYQIPNPECLALVDGRIQVVTEPTPLRGKFVGINSFGIGGTSGHVILEFDDVLPKSLLESVSNHVKRAVDKNQLQSGELRLRGNIPKLILASGRTDEAVKYFLNQTKTNLDKEDFVGLLQELALSSTPKHDYVGFALATSTGQWEVTSKSKKNSLQSIWYVYQGLGGQWIGMINDMIQFQKFKTSIALSSEYLRTVGVDLRFVFRSQNLDLLKDLRNAFVAIIACEIALTDLLGSLNIFPDGLLGHSLGEMTCAYADGCLTQEQTILVAFYRAVGFMESNLPPGTMVSVASGWNDVLKRCPSDIFPAIYNAENNITIGGPADSICSFVEVLAKEGIYAKEVKCAAHAFHTPYVQPCEQLMLKMLKEVIPKSKRRSSKWLSTSVPETNWGSLKSTHASAEYFVNNGISPVYLYQVLQHIPENSLVIEIGPHCFLQTILKQTLKNPAIVIGLMHCKHDNAVYFLKSMGTLFLAGFGLNITTLYEPVKFPAQVKTPSISPLIKWDHSLSWNVPHHKNELSASQGTKFVINLASDDSYSGHVIQNKIIFPTTGYICLVWEAYAKLHSMKFADVPIHIENITFKRITEFRSNQSLEFCVCISKNTGGFEIMEGNEIVCSGLIRKAYQVNEESLPSEDYETRENVLVHEDFYQLLHMKGYEYQGLFKGVQNIDIEARWAELKWNDNWVCFLDAMLQIFLLKFDANWKDFIVPLRIEAISIYPKMFEESLVANRDCVVKVSHCKYLNSVQCRGIKISGLKPTAIYSLVTKTPIQPAIAYQSFFPFFEPSPRTMTLDAALELLIGIVIDNSFSIVQEPFIFTEILEPSLAVSLNLQTMLCSKFEYFERRIVFENHHGNIENLRNSKIVQTFADLNLLPPSHVIWTNQEMKVNACVDLLVDNGFLVLSTSNDKFSSELNIIATRRTERENLYLLRKVVLSPVPSLTMAIDMPNFDWVDVLKEKLLVANNKRPVFVYSRSNISGIIGFTKCLIKEPGCQNIRCALICNSDPEISTPLSSHVLAKDLVFNVFQNNCWGTFVHMDSPYWNDPRLSEHVIGNIQRIGDLSSLCWVEQSNNVGKQEAIQVYFSSLNFHDVLYATGKLPKTAFHYRNPLEEHVLGLEFSGTYISKRVFGFSFGKCLATTLDHQPTTMWDVPDKWSLEDAATVPMAYGTALYALVIRGKLKRKETVLIHSGSGAVGLAAITVALDLNCVVYTTVGSAKKRRFLTSMFAHLPEDRILDSKLMGKFKEEILRQTKGRGVNLVLNSLAREQLKASLDCLGEGGRFLEIGKYDAYNNTTVGLQFLSKNVEIHGIHLDKLMAIKSPELEMLKNIFQEYLDRGKLKPLPFTSFSYANLEEAFRYFSKRTHVGKIIVKVREANGMACISAVPRTYFHPHKTYLIIGGLGGMGLEIISWMIERGAMTFFIVSRSGVSTSYQNYKLKKWESMGATIFLRNTDMSVRTCVFDLIMETLAIGPVGGIFNLAVVLEDGLFVNQTATKFELVTKCKVAASEHLDYVSRMYAQNLEHFVVFSSITSGRGNAGQTNYGYANSAMERICEQRRLDGFPALAIQWGPVGDVGAATKVFAGKSVINGILVQPIASCVATLDILLQQNNVVVSSVIFPKEHENLATAQTNMSLSEIVAGILGIQDISNIDETITMNEHGMDSIMAAQIQYAINRKKDDYIPVSSYGNLTFKDLAGMD